MLDGGGVNMNFCVEGSHMGGSSSEGLEKEGWGVNENCVEG